MTATESQVILRADRLRRTAEDGTVLLHDVSLTIAAGESVALVGSPGSGKTLLLRAIAQLDTLEVGDVLLKNDQITDDSVPKYRSRVIYVQQRATLVAGTVLENLRLPFAFSSHSHHSYDEALIATWLKLLGREPSFLQRATADLSGGESQLVAILRALQLNPVILLLDEPTSSLDQQTSSQVEALLRHWMEEDAERAMLIVTHDEAQAERLADRVVHLDGGKVVVSGGPS